LAIRRSALDRHGGFDETLPMYAEDIELGCRLTRAGETIAHLPDVTVVHVQGGTQPGRDVASTRWLDGLGHLYEHLNGGRGWRRFRWALAAGFASRAASLRLASSVGRNRAMAARSTVQYAYARHAWGLERPSDRRLRVALIGSRGIPATYSGFETFYEQLAVRLVTRGHRVTVYNRSHHHDERRHEYRGVRIVTMPTVRTKHLDTPVHALLSLLHAIVAGHDVLYLVIVGNSPLCVLARLLGRKIILNVDGEDFAREKWGAGARRYLRWSERIAARWADVVIADSTVIQRRYRDWYRRETVFIPYGANVRPRETTAAGRELLSRLGVQPGEYILFVSRMTPENRAHLLIEAHRRSGSRRQLVLVGDAPYVDAYRAGIHASCDGHRTIATGYLFAEDYVQISVNCRYFVLPAGIDGTRPVLLDQLAFGNCVLVRDTPANLEVIGDAGLSFSDADDAASLSAMITRLDEDDETVDRLRVRAVERVRSAYSWEVVTDQYERLFRTLL
jgi:glycosyltransferase involved in cell wall biosynthesis